MRAGVGVGDARGEGDACAGPGWESAWYGCRTAYYGAACVVSSMVRVRVRAWVRVRVRVRV